MTSLSPVTSSPVIPADTTETNERYDVEFAATSLHLISAQINDQSDAEQHHMLVDAIGRIPEDERPNVVECLAKHGALQDILRDLEQGGVDRHAALQLLAPKAEGMALALGVLARQITSDTPEDLRMTSGRPEITRSELPQLIQQIPANQVAYVVEFLSQQNDLDRVMLALEQGGLERGLSADVRHKTLRHLIPDPIFEWGPGQTASAKVFDAANAVSVERGRYEAEVYGQRPEPFGTRQQGHSIFAMSDGDRHLVESLAARNASSHAHQRRSLGIGDFATPSRTVPVMRPVAAPGSSEHDPQPATKVRSGTITPDDM